LHNQKTINEKFIYVILQEEHMKVKKKKKSVMIITCDDPTSNPCQYLCHQLHTHLNYFVCLISYRLIKQINSPI